MSGESSFPSPSTPVGKSKRASAPKSRNGCLTCKARRVKCDEAQPTCTACLKARRPCAWKRVTPRSRRIILPQNTSQLIHARPSETLRFTDPREATYFRTYQEEAALELSGLLRASAWTYTLLQACYQEPFALRAVVAIGALNKAIKQTHVAAHGPLSSRADGMQLARQHRAFALASYDKAIVGMKMIRVAPDDPASLRKALLACLLIYCIEIFLQSPSTALSQSQTGCTLLSQWLERKCQRTPGLASPDTTVIEDEIYHEVARLDLEYTIRWGVKDLERHSTRRLEGTITVKNMPIRFGSLQEAKPYLELILRRTYNLIGETYARIIKAKLELRHLWTSDSPGEQLDPCSMPAILFPDRDAYINDIKRWRKAFDPIFRKAVNLPDPIVSSAAALLRAHALNAEVRLAGAFFVQETDFDQFLPHFTEIVSLSQFIIHKTSRVWSMNSPIFVLPDSFERPLFDTATTCRNRLVRMEALSLLRSTAHRDPSKNQARMYTRACFLVGIEEEERLPNGDIPEYSRWRLIWTLNHYRSSPCHATIICARRAGYPLGTRYPAQREWKRRTFTQEEAETMYTSPWQESMHFEPWPAEWFMTKPMALAWREVHEELLGVTKRSRIG